MFFIRISPSANRGPSSANNCVRRPATIAHVRGVRSSVAVRAELRKSRSFERLSLCPCAPAPFPHKVSSLRCGTLRGLRKQGCLPCSSSEYRPQRTEAPCSANNCVRRLRLEQSRTTKYAPASRCAPNIAKAAHLSGFHFALARPPNCRLKEVCIVKKQKV